MPYRPNPAFARQMRENPEFRAGLREKADAIKTEAEALTPRSTASHRHAADSFEIVEEGAETLITNRAWWFTFIEFGTVNNPPYAPLRRGVQAAGFEFREAPKP